MSISSAQIRSNIMTIDNFTISENNELTLTINHEGMRKKYTITIDSDKKVVSATRIAPGTSTWDQLKTALANFFGTSNNARIVKEMNKLQPEAISSIQKNAIDTHKENELTRKRNQEIGNKIYDFLIMVDNDNDFDPLNNHEDITYANDIYNTASTNNKWHDLSDKILDRKDSTALIGSAIIFGNKEFFGKMFALFRVEEDSTCLNKVNAFMTGSRDNLKMLAHYIHDNYTENQENIDFFCVRISEKARSNLKDAGLQECLGGFPMKVKSKI